MSVFKTKDMQYRLLGNTGLKVSVLSLGNMINWKPQNAELDDTIILRALENGINFFDTAEMYADGKAQQALGRALKKSNVDRLDVVISTKIYKIGNDRNSKLTTSRKHIIEGVNASLKRLQLDYVDIIFAHSFDSETSMQETCRAFHQVIQDGKAFYWATSNWDAELIFEAFGVCDRLGLHRPIAEQLQYNMLVRKQFEEEFETLFDKYRYGTTVWSPLAGGYLTGKYLDTIPQNTRVSGDATFGADIMKQFFYNPHHTQKNVNNLKQLQVIAKELGYTLGQLALAWVLKNKDVSTALTGARNLQQLQQNLKAFELYKKWTPQLQTRVNKILDTTPTAKMNFVIYTPGIPRRP